MLWPAMRMVKKSGVTHVLACASVKSYLNSHPGSFLDVLKRTAHQLIDMRKRVWGAVIRREKAKALLGTPSLQGASLHPAGFFPDTIHASAGFTCQQPPNSRRFWRAMRTASALVLAQ